MSILLKDWTHARSSARCANTLAARAISYRFFAWLAEPLCATSRFLQSLAHG
jgi:hypothetical protein